MQHSVRIYLLRELLLIRFRITVVTTIVIGVRKNKNVIWSRHTVIVTRKNLTQKSNSGTKFGSFSPLNWFSDKLIARAAAAVARSQTTGITWVSLCWLHFKFSTTKISAERKSIDV